MAQQIIANIDINSDLNDVIRKCNYNFRIISANQLRKSRQDLRRVSGDLTEEVNDLIDDLSDETAARMNGDRDILETISNLLKYENDPNWDIDNDSSAFVSNSIDILGYQDIVVKLRSASGNPCYVPAQLLSSTPHDYEASGTTFNMSLSGTTLTVSVPQGYWEIWMR